MSPKMWVNLRGKEVIQVLKSWLFWTPLELLARTPEGKLRARSFALGYTLGLGLVHFLWTGPRIQKWIEREINRLPL